ncbi:MAG: hypothetical protein ACE5GE_14675, partial [Phycisphaerae bacterium]
MSQQLGFLATTKPDCSSMVTALGEYRKARRPTIKTILKRVGFLYRKCRKLLAFDLPGSNNSVAVEERAAVSIDGVWRFDV